MTKVYTTKGLVDIGELTIQDIPKIEGGARVMATEWRIGDELVRRDVHVNILVGQSMAGEQGDING
mgnify:CR=1 FL=1